MTNFQDLLEGKIDFEGQRKVEQISRVWITATAVISFILGFVLQSLRVTFGAFGISTILLCLVILPHWPIYNRNPVTWLPVKAQSSSTKAQ